MLKNLPGEVLNLWNNWEIRGMVLLSLLLQTILIISGPLRKTIAKFGISILVWSAYLSADMVATVALGNLARSQGDSSGDGSKKANNSIQAFWAPFLLLHLGGPDTITAYSIEDNELWVRHLLGLVVQVGVAFYVFSRSWGGGILPFIAIPMFIVGIIKYSERTWVLRSSCSKSLRKNTTISSFRSSYLRTRNQEIDQQREYLLQAYSFFHISKFTMQDLVPGYVDLIWSHLQFSIIPADDAFKVVEAELGLLYDMLYTKSPLIYSRSGIFLRCITFLLSITVFIIFQVKIEKHAYSSIDVAITYLLLVTAVFLELYAFLCLVFSDRTMIWLLDKGGNALTSAIYSRLWKLTTSKRWSRCISQYNLISSSIGDKRLKCLKLVGIDEMMRQMHVNREGLNGELQKFIFEHLLKKAEKMKENYNFFDKKMRSKIIGQRGDGVLEREGLLRNYKWCTTEVEFSRSIVVWHLATEICYGVDKDDASNDVSTSKCLSEYMMYLLVIRPNMLSTGFFDEGDLNTEDIIKSYRDAPRYDDAEFQRQWKTGEYLSVNGGPVLARQLLESISETKKRWEMIEEVWMEMLTHAAAHCAWKEHAHALRRGGELLTHVCFLMLHLGLSQQYQYQPGEEYWRWAELFPGEVRPGYYDKEKKEEDNYYTKAIDKYMRDIESSTIDEKKDELEKARDKYLQVTANLSSSSLDKKKKELQEAIEKYMQEQAEFSGPFVDKERLRKHILKYVQGSRNLSRSILDEIKEELQEAIEKYVQVQADFSRSILDEKKEELQEAIEKYMQVQTDFSRSILDKKKEELQQGIEKYVQVQVDFSRSILGKKKEELQEAIEKYVQAQADFSRSFVDKKKEGLQEDTMNYVQVRTNFSRSILDKEELQETIEKYVQVQADFSRSILDKQVKQLEEIIADKDQELEHKVQEFDRFRASLTSSTPQQGNDSLPRSLPTQTDNQGTGQSPLKNNEISLCMD